MLFLLNPKPKHRAARVARRRSIQRHAAAGTKKESSTMPHVRFVPVRRRRNRRRRNVAGQVRRGAHGRFVSRGGRKVASRRRRGKGFSWTRRRPRQMKSLKRWKGRTASAASRLRRLRGGSMSEADRIAMGAAFGGWGLNPRRRRRRNRRRHARAFNPPRRRRNRRHRRFNPGLRLYRRRHYRRNPGGRLVQAIKSVFSMDALVKVGAGVAGVSLALQVPKLLGKKWPQLNRGLGGVAVMGATSILSGALVSLYAPRIGRGMTYGGLIATGIGLLSALSCDFRKKAIPFETSLALCSLPTAPPAQMTQQQAAAALMAQGVDAATAAIATGQGPMQGLGSPGYRASLRDYLKMSPSGRPRQGRNVVNRMLGMGSYINSNYQGIPAGAPVGGKGRNRWSTVESFS